MSWEAFGTDSDLVCILQKASTAALVPEKSAWRSKSRWAYVIVSALAMIVIIVSGSILLVQAYKETDEQLASVNKTSSSDGKLLSNPRLPLISPFRLQTRSSGSPNYKHCSRGTECSGTKLSRRSSLNWHKRRSPKFCIMAAAILGFRKLRFSMLYPVTCSWYVSEPLIKAEKLYD